MPIGEAEVVDEVTAEHQGWNDAVLKTISIDGHGRWREHAHLNVAPRPLVPLQGRHVLTQSFFRLGRCGLVIPQNVVHACRDELVVRGNRPNVGEARAKRANEHVSFRVAAHGEDHWDSSIMLGQLLGPVEISADYQIGR